MRERVLRWGLLGNGTDQPDGDPTAPSVGGQPPARGGQPRAGDGGRLREGVGDRARPRLLRGPAVRSRDRRRVHPPAEPPPRGVGDPGRPRGEARPVREAARAHGRGSGRHGESGPRERRRPRRGVHVPPPPADPEGQGAGGGRRDRGGALRPGDLQLHPRPPGRRAPPAGVGRRVPLGRGLLPPQLHPLPARRGAGGGVRLAGAWGRAGSTRRSRASSCSPAACSRRSTPASAARFAPSSRSPAAPGRSACATRGSRRRTSRSSSRGATRPRPSRWRSATDTCWRSRTWPTAPGRAGRPGSASPRAAATWPRSWRCWSPRARGDR